MAAKTTKKTTGNTAKNTQFNEAVEDAMYIHAVNNLLDGEPADEGWEEAYDDAQYIADFNAYMESL